MFCHMLTSMACIGREFVTVDPSRSELFTVWLAGSLGCDESPGSHPRRDIGWEGNNSQIPAFHHFPSGELV